MDTLSVRNKIGKIADVSSKFFIGTTNAPKQECMPILLDFNYRNMEIITMSKQADAIEEMQNIMLEVFKRKGNYDKQLIRNNTIEGNTKWYKLFAAY